MYLAEVVARDDLEVGWLGRLLGGIGTAGIGLRIGLTYKQVSMASDRLYIESNKCAENGRQERERFDAFLHAKLSLCGPLLCL